MKKTAIGTEKELRFILTDSEYETIHKRVTEAELPVIPGYAVHEMTVMYDNPNPDFTFYSKEVDGRLRVRTSKPGISELCEETNGNPGVTMVTWKQRIPECSGQEINQEREVEISICSDQVDAMIYILEEVLHCPRISSYERNRETLYLYGVEIASDTFPYGHVVELELKETEDEKALYKVADLLGLSNCHKSTRSCDDMYRLLCEKSGIEPKDDILFADKTMPCLNDAFERGVIE